MKPFAFLRGLALAMVLSCTALAAGPALADGKIYTSWGVAIDGADPVAYFTDGKSVEGKREFSAEWNGATWRFASAEHRALFLADPERYAPQYGGYCAWAVSQGYTASTEPENWRIVDGKLYLNYSRSVQKDWEQDIPANITKGDANWPTIQSDLK